MISDEQVDLIIERLMQRMQEANVYFLTNVGNSIKKLRKLRPSEAHELIQILKYGSNYDDIVKKISKLTNLNIREVDEIFEKYAKIDQDFYKRFYKYRNIPFIKFEENQAIKRQTREIALVVKQQLYDFTRQNVLGYTIKDEAGHVIFKGLKNIYDDLLDTAIMSVSEGKQTFDDALRKIIKEVGGSGLKYIDYKSGRSVRLDSAVRQSLKQGLRTLHNANQEIYGQEFGSDGVEISVHENPAPDHEKVQGRQFANEEFKNFQNDVMATSYDGVEFPPEYEGRDRRSISEYNCYHYIFPIILGVSKPEYTDKELQEIIDRNEKGFDLDGKHYTMYEGTQLQRQIETEIRKQKDIQILARESGRNDVVNEAQENITKLTRKYKELSDVSGLKTKMGRLRVSGYHRINSVGSSKPKQVADVNIDVLQEPEVPKMSREDEFYMYVGDLRDKNIEVDGSIMLVDEDIRNRQLEQLDKLASKYPVDRYNKDGITLQTKKLKGNRLAEASYNKKYIALGTDYFKDKNTLLASEENSIKYNWHYKTPKNDLDIYSITHEYGHQIEYEYLRKIKQQKVDAGRFWDFDYKETDKDLRDTLMSMTKRRTGEKLNVTQFKNKYFSGYAKSKNHYEWFAEIFAQSQLGEKTPFTEVFIEWLEDFFK